MIVCENNNALAHLDSAGFEELVGNAGNLRFVANSHGLE
jgi:hypothetical protein